MEHGSASNSNVKSFRFSWRKACIYKRPVGSCLHSLSIIGFISTTYFISKIIYIDNHSSKKAVFTVSIITDEDLKRKKIGVGIQNVQHLVLI